MNADFFNYILRLEIIVKLPDENQNDLKPKHSVLPYQQQTFLQYPSQNGVK